MKLYLAILLVAIAVGLSDAQNKVFCFYGGWATYRPGIARFDIEDVDAHRCTHVTYSFIGLWWDGSVRILDDWADVQLGGFRRAVELKRRNPNLKVLVSMGGWNEGSEVYSHVVNNPGLRANMVNNVYNFVTQWGFDGFDFDWEYPAQRGGIPNDYWTYIDFLRELRARFGTRLLITAAVGANPSYIGTSYNVPSMNFYLDYINLMTYDFHGSWDGRTGQNSPLYASSGDANRELNIHAAIQNWIRHGTSPQKLFLGLGFYGQSFTLANPNNNGLHAPTVGPGAAGEFSQQGGLMMYLEICRLLNQGGWGVVFDWEQMSPYMFRGNQWIGYDNQESIRIKTRYARDNNLAGVMMWSIDYEDHRNNCGQGAFPLLSAIWDVFRSNDEVTQELKIEGNNEVKDEVIEEQKVEVKEEVNNILT